ncbi:AAA family ATPase [Faecalicatena contorta]|uniref:cytidylate kinase-like family protein n=1 Tax=Faecalicatena contorta TaxID=39482 RepID=UPI001F216028|nr:cytidylate kinase-like family protein [Faecalicatena contorta]MCF2683154.1 cytidylate kinase-like family protein [Faecalicatena contorta]
MKNRIITISREFGSGGRTIGKKVAEKEPCVIVGRCADYILRDHADCLKVFIHASMEFRAKRIVEVYGEQEKSPIQRLKEKDKRRAAYHRFYTDMKWGHAQNYHITLDSGELGIDKCVEILQSLY